MNASLAGREITRAIAYDRHDALPSNYDTEYAAIRAAITSAVQSGNTATIGGMSYIMRGLSWTQCNQVETALRLMVSQYPWVARIDWIEFATPATTTTSPSSLASSSSIALVPSSETTSIHAIIETNDNDALHALLATKASSPSSLISMVNQLCPRTGLTPLHKAVQEDNVIAVTALLAARADATIACALYDDDTPIALAHRLRATAIIPLFEQHQQQLVDQ